MADTSFATGNALAVKHWSAALFKQALMDMFFSKFTSKSDGSLIQQKFDLTKDVGDQMTFALRMKLSGAGIIGDSTLEGSEEAMVFHNFAQKITLKSNGVKAAGKMSVRMTKVDIQKEAKDALADWLAESLEKNTISALSGIVSTDATVAVNAPSTNRKWYGGQTAAGVVASVANDAAITSLTAHLFGPEVISVIRRKAQLATPKIRPVKVNGSEWYVLFIHPLQAKALQASTAWKNAQLNAADRGKDNPLFTGAIGAVDGVIVHVHNGLLTRAATEVFESGDAVASSMNVARALFCGAQAAVIGYGQYPGWYEKDFDYDRVPGVATDVIYGIGKTEFNSEDFGVITVDTQATPD